LNPLHIEPSMAAQGGFSRPILHGLCTYGLGAKAVVETCCDKDPHRISKVQARFTAHVFPGEKILFKMWKQEN